MNDNYRIRYKASKSIKVMIEKLKEKNNSIITDPNGSYTGVTYPEIEKPVQDVDDL